ncbi:MAG TPA: DUF3455 domain-containing protein [Caulobacteraceae bacterium]|jgi:hypothetical protein
MLVVESETPSGSSFEEIMAGQRPTTRRRWRLQDLMMFRALSWLTVFAMAADLGDPSISEAQPAHVSAPRVFGVAGRMPVLVVHAIGAQIYECKSPPGAGSIWVFREPIATLVRNGVTVGRHYAGPTWELTDGDMVTGRQSASAPGVAPSDAPLLKLDVVQHRGSGALKDAKLVLRLNTHGGALKGKCPTPGELRAEPYSADYVFLR